MARIGTNNLLFFRESMRSLGPTASLLPSSRHLAHALTEPIDFRNVVNLVELGPGTGAITSTILSRLRPDARLFAIDINHRFVDHLRLECSDPRLIPLCGSAADIGQLLEAHGVERVDAVVSSLGLTAMDNRLRVSIMSEVRRMLSPKGTVTQYQYLHAFAGHKALRGLRFMPFDERRFLRRFFSNVSARPVALNFPPALVFACQQQPR